MRLRRRGGGTACGAVGTGTPAPPRRSTRSRTASRAGGMPVGPQRLRPARAWRPAAPPAPGRARRRRCRTRRARRPGRPPDCRHMAPASARCRARRAAVMRHSSCSARAASISLLRRVRGRGSSSRAACMPGSSRRTPRARRAAIAPTARTSASGSTPGCDQKRRSSVAISRSRKRAGHVVASSRGTARRRPARAAWRAAGPAGPAPRSRSLEPAQVGRVGAVERPGGGE